MYYGRTLNNQPAIQKGDPLSYRSSVGMYKKWDIEERNYRAMQAWAVGIIASPVVLSTVSPSAIIASLRLKLVPVVVDAGIQTIVNGMQHKNIFSSYNFASGAASLLINAPEGATLNNMIGVAFANSTIGASVNLSSNSLSGISPIFSFDPRSIIINTAFGTAAGQYSNFIGSETGSSTFGDAAASPINLGGAVIDQGTKKNE